MVPSSAPSRLRSFSLSARLLLASLCLSAAACSGPDGATGPAGNANVKTKAFTLTSAQWVWNSNWALTTAGSSETMRLTRHVELDEPLITDSILADGMVLVYFQPDVGANAWTPLPYSFQGVSNFYHFVYEVSVGRISLHYYWTALPGETTPVGLSTFTLPTYRFKYIVVQGTAIAPMLAARTNVNDPGAVERFLATHRKEVQQ